MKKMIKVLIKEALKAYKLNEIPVGAVIACNNKIIAKAHNNRQKKNYLLGHAEINAIIKAERKLKDWRLDNCELYVTMSPCKMCEAIIHESRINKIYYLLDNENNKPINDRYIKIKTSNEMVENYKKLIQNFFEKLRK